MQLAVVIGNAFERYVATISNFVIGPMFHASLDFFLAAKPPNLGFINGFAGFQMFGGEHYQTLQQNGTIEFWSEPPYASNEEARADGAKIVDITELVAGTLGFVLSLLNIYWFFGCVAKTEQAENLIKAVYAKGQEKSKKAAIHAAKRAGTKFNPKALEMLNEKQRAKYDAAFAKYDTE